MSEFTRRGYLQGTLAALTGAAASPLPQEPHAPRRTAPSGKGGLVFTELLYPTEQHKIALSAQSGLKYAILGVASVLDSVSRERYVEVLEQLKAEMAHRGLGIAGVESHPVNCYKKRGWGCPAGTRRSKITSRPLPRLARSGFR
jgi:hypothetical protein